MADWFDTWTCHICGEVRPDAKISVYKRELTIPGTPPGNSHMNVRYCNDNTYCPDRASIIETFDELKKG